MSIWWKQYNYWRWSSTKYFRENEFYLDLDKKKATENYLQRMFVLENREGVNIGFYVSIPLIYILYSCTLLTQDIVDTSTLLSLVTINQFSPYFLLMSNILINQTCCWKLHSYKRTFLISYFLHSSKKNVLTHFWHFTLFLYLSYFTRWVNEYYI